MGCRWSEVQILSPRPNLGARRLMSTGFFGAGAARWEDLNLRCTRAFPGPRPPGFASQSDNSLPANCSLSCSGFDAAQSCSASKPRTDIPVSPFGGAEQYSANSRLTLPPRRKARPGPSVARAFTTLRYATGITVVVHPLTPTNLGACRLTSAGSFRWGAVRTRI